MKERSRRLRPVREANTPPDKWLMLFLLRLRTCDSSADGIHVTSVVHRRRITRGTRGQEASVRRVTDSRERERDHADHQEPDVCGRERRREKREKRVREMKRKGREERHVVKVMSDG